MRFMTYEMRYFHTVFTLFRILRARKKNKSKIKFTSYQYLCITIMKPLMLNLVALDFIIGINCTVSSVVPSSHLYFSETMFAFISKRRFLFQRFKSRELFAKCNPLT